MRAMLRVRQKHTVVNQTNQRNLGHIRRAQTYQDKFSDERA